MQACNRGSSSLEFHSWIRRAGVLFLGWFLSLVPGFAAPGPFFISEILFNPPGPDAPNEYIELRGPANATLPAGTYLIALEGDAEGNPGTVQDLFDLSGRTFGGNGFLVLLQRTNSYTPSPLSRVLVQTGSDAGWGHGGNSSLKHRGELGQTDIENPSVTFLLINSTPAPSIGDDLDVPNLGTLDPQRVANWKIYDSVGILDDDGAGDVAYGRVNFRRAGNQGSGAIASGTIVPVTFTAGYVARNGNSTGDTAADWVASDLAGTGPANFALGDATHAWPAALAGSYLNHLGAPNFGAPPLPGVLVSSWANASPVPELGGTNVYSLALNSLPSQPVVLQMDAEEGAEFSLDKGISYGSHSILRLSDTNAAEVWIRTVPNNVVEPSPRTVSLRHKILPLSDPAYLDVVVPSITLSILDDDSLLFSEVLANPVGSDEGREFIELQGTPGGKLKGVYIVQIESNPRSNPGTVRWVVDLSGVVLGSAGLALVSAPSAPYVVPPTTQRIDVPAFAVTGGVIPNDSLSLLLITSSSIPKEGQDWDAGDNGVLEGLPKNAVILDSVAWLDGAAGALAYGAMLSNSADTVPDAATRFPGNLIPRNAGSWFFGDLKAGDPSSLRYDRGNGGTNIPPGAVLTPGTVNNTPPQITKLDPISGAVGDPTNPSVEFVVSDAETPAGLLQVSVSSNHPEVVPDAGLHLTSKGAGRWVLSLEPVGAGYASVVVQVTDGTLTDQSTLHYAASHDGSPTTRYLMGAGDGSTAIPLPDDLILVGDDENEVIRLYDRTTSGLPLAGFDMRPYLGLTDIENGQPREVDIEGSTRVGNRLFWMGAHSHSGLAESRTNRSRLFATDLTHTAEGWGLSYVGRYDYLKLDLVNWDHGNVHGKGVDYYGLLASTAEGVDPKAPDGSGFNLEGLAMAPGSSETAFVACRAPLVPASRRTHALIIPVLNFTSIAASNAPPGSAKFGEPIELDLFGRGIRSIEGTDGQYLIVAGPPRLLAGKYPDDFRLYTWTGKASDAPQMRAASLDGLNPEGIVSLPELPWTAVQQVQLLSDCGTRVWYGDGVITKLLTEVNFKKCRLDWVTLGPITVPPPVILSARWDSDQIRVRWRGTVGERYRLQWTGVFAQPDWQDVDGVVTATDVFVEKIHPGPPAAARYYRVVLVP